MAFMYKGTDEWLNSISVSENARKKLDSAIENLSTKAAQDNIMFKNEDSDMNKEKNEAELQDAENEEVKSEVETETKAEAEVETDVEEKAEEVPAEETDTEETKAESVLAVVEKALNEVAEVIVPMQKEIAELKAEIAALKAAKEESETKSENIPFLSLNFNSMLEAKSVTEKSETPDADALLKEAPEEAEEVETETEQGFIPFFNFS